MYVNSAYLTQVLGEYIAIGLQQLDVNAEDIHLIGHSLGAQIVGSAGRHYMKLTGEPIERITGLDPARPCFVGEVAFPRLSRKNAKFVDIIHSNPGDLGTEENIGDVDFYPGGLEVTKPGCWKISLLCSHERAIDYYIESVYPENEKNFMGKQCQDYSELESETCKGSLAPMGFAAKENIHGIYYLDVDGDSPYGLDATKNPLEEFKTCGVCPYTSFDYYG